MGHLFDTYGSQLGSAFWITIQLTFWAAIGSVIWGTLLAAMRVSPVPILRLFGSWYVNIVRNTPLTLIIVFCSVGLYQNLGLALAPESDPTFIDDNNFRLAVLGFIVYTAAFVCESLRAGINTVPLGQAEAARSLGLTFGQSLRMIVLPQAFRAVVAPLGSVLIALTKNTTIASTIGVAEASLLMKTMIENEADQLFLVFAIFAVGFMVLTLPVGFLFGYLGKRLAVKR
ncbi:amino acid ABC transporter permease [Rhodococcus sp. D2-41]|uniref:Amino acid ABC transporter permease n=1 Tax=Speluncibacter jeojiensis TaxID=2710754 RepID=A0A9X4LWQ1_9ACTN|nr:amino acid ABC transporter permease [Rhodococcus sp. D2-41]MDG3010759.1 amino acid ABC transporter permease [Rhodococcus sp. D2-41]MDG3013740.1 amino acid ABC transporter permease [Corynebacteriales bacterium D3-21]